MGKELESGISVKMQAAGLGWWCNAAGARAVGCSLTPIAPRTLLPLFGRLFGCSWSAAKAVI